MFYDITRWSDFDIYLFAEGTHTKLYNHFGAHVMERAGERGVYFSLWAPNALGVSVRGDFNNYATDTHPLKKRADASGIWEGFISGIGEGVTYKYHITTPNENPNADKADPFAFYAEVAPASASRIYERGGHVWRDGAWMKSRKQHNKHTAPVSIYEVHLGSWRRDSEGNFLNYVAAAHALAEYLKALNFTHVELLPITEHPFEGSWGYQVNGYFAPTARYGSPEDFIEFVEIMHAHEIGVILDWVPSHFVMDGHGLMNFDGTCLYEHKDPRKGYHPEWGSAIFNYDRNEVRAFLISSALFWLEEYHLDGIRVDAVASMLYLDFGRKEGEWVCNEFGNNLNYGAIGFLQALNTAAYGAFDDIMMFAEESTAYPMVSRSVADGGLGFGYKWNMGWMHDTLRYFKLDPIARQHHHHELTFAFYYMYHENYTLPLSHDEVVHMKGSLINKMAGDYNQKFANLRAMYAFMMTHPGKKLLFMGGEIAQFSEWNYQKELDWSVLEYPQHQGIQRLIAKLNGLYKSEPSLHKFDTEVQGFEWIDDRDHSANVLTYMRKGGARDKSIIVVCNFSDHLREGYTLGVPVRGSYEEIFNSQSPEFEGWGRCNREPITSTAKACHGRKNSITLTLPSLSVLFLKKI